jgi:hypothetical protein
MVSAMPIKAAARTMPCATCADQIRHQTHFIQDCQLVFLGSKVGFRIGELGPVRRRSEIEADRWPGGANLQREGGFADMPRPEHCQCWRAADCFTQMRFHAALQQSVNFRV